MLFAAVLALATLAGEARAQHGAGHGAYHGGGYHGGSGYHGGGAWHGAPGWHGGWYGPYGEWRGWYGPNFSLAIPYFFPPYYAPAPGYYPPPVAVYPPSLGPGGASSYEVYFESGSDRLTNDANAVVERAAAAFRSTHNSSIGIIGHSDRSGNAADNLALSERRARNVADALIRAGIPGNSIFVSAQGENQPAVPTPDGVAEPRNRRVTMVLGGRPAS